MFNQLSGATRLFPILGDPVRYAESPSRLTSNFDARGHNGVCIPMQVRTEDLGSVMAALTATSNVDGILVTMPHKSTAFAYCTTASERARRLGVVNVIRRNPDGTWHGDMFDGIAFVKAQKDHGAALEGARALLIGAGGAGSAIAAALLESGVRDLVVNDTNELRVRNLVERLARLGHGRVIAGPPDPTDCHLVINATPLGMHEGDPLPVDAALLRSSMFAGDVVAGHGVTPFLRAAQAAGCRTAGGGPMVEAVQQLIIEFLLGN
jgi:shikimate dehydrogenase